MRERQYERGDTGRLHFLSHPVPDLGQVDYMGLFTYLGEWADEQRARMLCFLTADDEPEQRVYLYPEEIIAFEPSGRASL